MKSIAKLLLIGAIAFAVTGVMAHPVKKETKQEQNIKFETVKSDVTAFEVINMTNVATCDVIVKDTPVKSKDKKIIVKRSNPSLTTPGKYKRDRSVKVYNGTVKKYGSHR